MILSVLLSALMLAVVIETVKGSMSATTSEGADECYFPQNYTFATPKEVLDCWKTIPYNGAVAYQTTQNILDYLQMFVFKDILKNPPEPFQGLQNNVVSCVENIMDRVRNGGFPTDYEFHQSLSDIFLPGKDPHTQYRKPSCYTAFKFLLPFSLGSHIEDSEQVLTIEHLPLSYKFYETLYRERYEFDESLYGGRIVRIEGDNDPIEYLARWADEWVYSSKIHDSRFNDAIASEFWSRSNSYYGIPNPEVVHLSVLPAGETDRSKVVDLEIAWGAINTREIMNNKHFNEMCPILDVTFSPEALVYGTIPEPESETNKTRQQEQRSHNETPIERFVRELKQKSNFGAGFTGESENGQFVELAFGDQVSLYSYKPKDPNDSRVIVLLNIPSFSPDNVDNFVDTFLQGLDEAKKLGMTHLIVNVISNGGGWVTLGYRCLRVLAPYLWPVFGEYDIVQSPPSDLLLPTALSRQTQERIDPDTYEPFEGDEWYTEGVTKVWEDFEGCTGPLSDSKYHVVRDGSYSETYSQRYVFEVAYDEGSFTEAFERLDNYDGLSLPPQNIAIVTDGLCGSTCACFSKHAQETHAATMVGVGGLMSSPVESMDVSSFAGGSVSDSQYMEPFLNLSGSVQNRIPYSMPTNAYFRWAFEEVFSWDETVTTPLEFYINPIDIRVPYWPSASVETFTGYSQMIDIVLANVFDKYSASSTEYPDFDTSCLPNMKVPDSSCDSDIEHGTCARPCAEDGTHYDQNKAVVFRCDDGYYLHLGTGSCQERPEASIPVDGSFPTSGIVLISIAAVIVIVCVMFIVLIKCNLIKCSSCSNADDGVKEAKVPLLSKNKKAQNDVGAVGDDSREITSTATTEWNGAENDVHQEQNHDES